MHHWTVPHELFTKPLGIGTFSLISKNIRTSLSKFDHKIFE